jgi:hypothetical protein
MQERYDLAIKRRNEKRANESEEENRVKWEWVYDPLKTGKLN